MCICADDVVSNQISRVGTRIRMYMYHYMSKWFSHGTKLYAKEAPVYVLRCHLLGGGQLACQPLPGRFSTLKHAHPSAALSAVLICRLHMNFNYCHLLKI